MLDEGFLTGSVFANFVPGLVVVVVVGGMVLDTLGWWLVGIRIVYSGVFWNLGFGC